jgi:hypothetical protein
LAAFTLAFARCPHATHSKSLWLRRLAASTTPYSAHVCELYATVTSTTAPPCGRR